jgi:hypothetical protein
LVTWTKDINNPIFIDNRYCVFPFKSGDYYYMLACKSITSTPGLTPTVPNNRKIELYRDSSPTFYPDEREYLGVAIFEGGTGAWDAAYLDTPCVITDDITRSTFPTGNIQMYYTGWNGSTWGHGLAVGALPS